MSATDWLSMLLRSTLLMAVSAIVLELLIRGLQIRAPRWRRAAWAIVIVQGVIWLRFDIALPLLPSHGASQPIPQRNIARSEDSGRANLHPPADIPRSTRLPESAPSWSWSTLLVVGWLVGVVVQLGRLAGAHLRFTYWISRHATPADELWRTDYRAVLGEQGISKAPDLLAAPRCGPLAWHGMHGAAIIVPAHSGSQFNAAQRRAILRHELEHWRRNDLWTALVARLLVLPHWFNPAAVWAVRRYEEAAEWICDDRAIRDPANAPEFARILLSLGSAGAATIVAPAVGRRSAVAQRIERLVHAPQSKETIMRRAVLCVALSASLLVAGIRIQVVAQEPDRPATLEKAKLATENAKNAVLQADSKPASNTRREDLRYKGKPFEYWAELARTDLSPDAQLEALGAMAVFGKRGHAQEAIDVVLDIVQAYPQGVRYRNEYGGYNAFSPSKVLGELASLAPEQLARELNNQELTRRHAAAIALQAAGPAAVRVVPQLIEAIASDDETAESAVAALGKTCGIDSRARTTILQVIERDTDGLAQVAFNRSVLYWPNGNDELNLGFAEHLKRSSPEKRRRAADSPVQNSVKLLPVMLVLLTDEDPEVRLGAIRSIRQMAGALELDDPRVVPALIRAISRGGDEEALEGLVVLQELGRRAKPAARFLRTLVAAPEVPDDVQKRAEAALQNIEGSTAETSPAVRAAAEKALRELLPPENGSEPTP